MPELFVALAPVKAIVDWKAKFWRLFITGFPNDAKVAGVEEKPAIEDPLTIKGSSSTQGCVTKVKGALVSVTPAYWLVRR